MDYWKNTWSIQKLAGKEEQRTDSTGRRQKTQNGRLETNHIKNYFKWKWTKQLKGRKRQAEFFFKAILCCIQDTYLEYKTHS